LIVSRKINLLLAIRDRDNRRWLVRPAHELAFVSTSEIGRVRVDWVKGWVIASFAECSVCAVRTVKSIKEGVSESTVREEAIRIWWVVLRCDLIRRASGAWGG